MTKTVTLNDTETNLVRLATATKEAGEQQLIQAFNNALAPVLRAHSVPDGKVSLNAGANNTITLSWEEAEPAKAPIRARRGRKGPEHATAEVERPALVSA